MSLLLKSRSLDLERMDMETLGRDTAANTLGALETINLWLGGVRATLWHLKRFSKRWMPGERIRIIDWGTGGADMPRAIVRWGRQNGFRIEIVGIDRNPEILDYARQASRDFPEIKIMQDDIVASPGLPAPSPDGRGTSAAQGEAELFDYAVSSLCLHHLSDTEIIDLLKKSDRVTTRGFIMNDLKRSARAWAWIWALSRLGRAHPIVQNDGPLSVKRAFTTKELETLAKAAGITYANVYTHFGYRLTLAGEKASPGLTAPSPIGRGTSAAQGEA
jgi:hypothetical protein